MRKLFEELNALLETIDYSKIWKGFSKFKFALYNGEKVYFEDKVIDWNRAFLGNTTINYEGEQIAIWNVKNLDETDVKTLAADMVHEMFHAFQQICGESRYPDDLALLDYPEDLKNYELKHEENLLLVKAFRTKDLAEKKNLIENFMANRLYREKTFGEAIKQEYFTETSEGLAEFVGSQALKQIDEELFNERLENYCKRIEMLNENIFDMRRSLYYTGAVFGFVLSEIGFDLWHEIKGETKTAFEMASHNISAKKCEKISETSAELKELFEKQMEGKGAKFQDFLDKSTETTEGDFFICGYDPMNMFKSENKILCTHFIMLKNDTMTEPLFIKGPVLLYLEENSKNHVLSYRV